MDWQTSNIEPEIIKIDRVENILTLDICATASLFQFQGHFPQKKILPGVAQLDWAVRYTRQYFEIHSSIHEISQLKYRKFIEPDMTVQLKLDYQAVKNHVAFRYSSLDDVFSSGIIKLRPQ
ncbi:ApeI family dehydratase [Curvivirga aplysinae]|uniref:ApeI family dehydratase n=1 Tax=Curvivirga aplysinae TaxID=2529852 RepID=UPI0012BC3BD9|nr:hypothetical protein [Curvivirga aplysinae]MTI11031.1 hypothetical protein [Curvivirga aplysinae]